MKRKQLIEATIEDYGFFTKDIDKLAKQKGDYFIRASWGNGFNDTMGTAKEVKETIRDKMTRDSDDSYDLEIVNIKTGKAITWNAKIVIELKNQS